jgi:type IV secretory pathway TrbD component
MEEQRAEPVQQINDIVFMSAIEPTLYGGCEFNLFWLWAGFCFVLFILLFFSFQLPLNLFLIPVFVMVFMLGRYYLRQLAKSDPIMFTVYRRHLLYNKDYYAAVGKLLLRRRHHKLRKTTLPFQWN